MRIQALKRPYLAALSLFLMLLLSACAAPVAAPAPESSAADAAASGEPAAGEVANLTMTVWGSEDDAAVYTERLALAEAAIPGVRVELVYIPAEYDQKVQTMIAGGTGPDILQLAEAVHAFSSKGQIVPLDECIAANGVNLEERFGTQAGHMYARDGVTYALPDRGGAMILYYNVDMFDAAGIEYPTADWTWTEFRDAANKLTIRDGETVTQWGFAAGDWWPWWMSFMYQNAGRVIDADGVPVVNSPENVEALQVYQDLVHVDKVAPSPTDYANMGQGIGPDPLFAQGKVAMIMTGFWNIASLKSVEGINWDIAPVFKNVERATAAFGSGLAISRDSKNAEAACKVISFLTGEEGQLPIVTNGQDAPANVAVLGSPAFLEADWAGKPINMAAFADSADAIFVPPLIPQWNEMMKIFGDNLAAVFAGDAEVQPTLDQIQTQLTDLLAQ